MLSQDQARAERACSLGGCHLDELELRPFPHGDRTEDLTADNDLRKDVIRVAEQRRGCRDLPTHALAGSARKRRSQGKALRSRVAWLAGVASLPCCGDA